MKSAIRSNHLLSRVAETTSGTAASAYLISCMPVYAQEQQAENTPASLLIKNNPIKKWRIGYYEGGQFTEYLTIFRSTLYALMDMGWIESAKLPKTQNHRKFWQWVNRNIKSDYIEFVEDAFYSADFDNTLREKTKREIIKRLNTESDIDLMMALGTWAGLDLANDEHTVNTLITSSNDPVAAGMIISRTDSGYDHIHVHVEPDHYIKQVQIFHQMIGFDRLGIVYENTQEGRSYSSVDKIEKSAVKLGFTLVHCHPLINSIKPEQAIKNVEVCYEELAKKVKAIYVTDLMLNIPINQFTTILTSLSKEKIYTFAQVGSILEAGAMLSIKKRDDARYAGRFYASNIVKVLNGAMPGSLNQIYATPSKITINLKAAKRAGYILPIDVLEIIDEFYDG